MRKPHICFVTATLNAGGTELFLLRTTKRVKEEKQVTVLVKSNISGDLKQDFNKLGVPVVYIKVGYFSFSAMFKMLLFMKRNKFTTVCDLTGDFAGLIMVLAYISGIPNRIAFYRKSRHFFEETKFKLLYADMVNRLTYLAATKLLSNSQTAFDFYFRNIKTHDNPRFKVIPNGVDASQFKTVITKEQARKSVNIPNDVFLIGHVGRYDPAKNHETIFKVAAKLKKTEPDIRFLFCGKNTDSVSFRDRLKAHGIEDVCITIGLSDELPIVFKSMDLFYFPSLTEGQPNAMIEAMVAGLPVLPSNILPILEALPAKAKDNTVAPEDVDAAVSKITSLIGNPELQDQYRYGEWAVKQFNQQKNFELFKRKLDGE